ncbi:MAG TPA: hypothetical protein VF824_01885 [Thermoanaerobaculia bacterium]
MKGSHYTRDDFLAYLDGNEDVADPAAIDAHLEHCATCASVLAQVREDYKILSDPALWEQALDTVGAARSARDDLAREEHLKFALDDHRRRAAEVAQAELTFAELSSRSPDVWLEHLFALPAERTDSLVMRVVQEARAIEEQAPLEALRLLDAAQAIVLVIDDEQITAATIGAIWKERANTLTALGDYAAALTALVEAEREYARSIVAPYDLALVDWARANVYFQMGEYSRVLPLTREAKRTLRRFGDTLRATHVQVLEACTVHEQGNIERAEEMYLALLIKLQNFGDEITSARVLANLACCRLQRNDLMATEAYAARATAIYAKHGLDTEITRTRWALAKALLARGDRDAGVAALGRIAAEFESLGMSTDAAAVRLDIVEELINGEEYARAAELATQVATTFALATEKLNLSKALDALRRATVEHRPTRDLIREARHILMHPHLHSLPPSA